MSKHVGEGNRVKISIHFIPFFIIILLVLVGLYPPCEEMEILKVKGFLKADFLKESIKALVVSCWTVSCCTVKGVNWEVTSE